MELTANAIQTVVANGNVLFTDTPVAGNCSIIHREGSGLTTLKGLTNQCRARYRVSFGGNIAIPSGGTVAPISLAISIEGEPIPATTAVITPAAANNYFNVFTAIYIDVPKGTSYSIGIKNTSGAAINIQNANLIVERTA